MPKLKESLIITPVDDPGNPHFTIKGSTHAIKDALREGGAFWMGAQLYWVLDGATIPKAIQDAIGEAYGLYSLPKHPAAGKEPETKKDLTVPVTDKVVKKLEDIGIVEPESHVVYNTNEINYGFGEHIVKVGTKGVVNHDSNDGRAGVVFAGFNKIVMVSWEWLTTEPPKQKYPIREYKEIKPDNQTGYEATHQAIYYHEDGKVELGAGYFNDDGLFITTRPWSMFSREDWEAGQAKKVELQAKLDPDEPAIMTTVLGPKPVVDKPAVEEKPNPFPYLKLGAFVKHKLLPAATGVIGSIYGDNAMVNVNDYSSGSDGFSANQYRLVDLLPRDYDLPMRQIEFLQAIRDHEPVKRNAATRAALRRYGMITNIADWDKTELTPAGAGWLEHFGPGSKATVNESLTIAEPLEDFTTDTIEARYGVQQGDDVIYIPVKHGYTALVDPVDADLAEFQWSPLKGNADLIYVQRKITSSPGKQKTVFLHRLILERILDRTLERHELTDHEDGNPMNCRRSNLRLANYAESNQNRRKPAHNTSGFKGVHRHRDKWAASIDVDGEHVSLGDYDTPELANEARLTAEKKYHGEFRREENFEPDGTSPWMIENQKGIQPGQDWLGWITCHLCGAFLDKEENRNKIGAIPLIEQMGYGYICDACLGTPKPPALQPDKPQKASKPAKPVSVPETSEKPVKSAFESKSKVTPLRAQYLEIKAQYPDCILFFRLGDFYETFDGDAEIIARECDLVLTGRPISKSERVPMSGVPHHALDQYILMLVEKGYSIAVAEQIGEPVGSGVVERKVIRTIKPSDIKLEPASREWTKKLVRIKTHGGDMSAEADVYGQLAVHTIRLSNRWSHDVWSLTHIASGRTVVKTSTDKSALMRLTEQLSAKFDFNEFWENAQKGTIDETFKEQVEAVISGKPIPDSPIGEKVDDERVAEALDELVAVL